MSFVEDKNEFGWSANYAQVLAIAKQHLEKVQYRDFLTYADPPTCVQMQAGTV